MMKKYIIALTLTLLSIINCSAEFRWGPTVGVNISTFHWKQRLVETNAMAGVNAGVMGEVMIPGIGFGVDFGLRYSMHGAKVNFGEHLIWSSDGYGKENVTLHSVQIPLNLRFKWTRMEGFEHYLAPFVYAGPVFNFNVSMSDVKCVEYPTGSVAIQCGLGAEILERFQIGAGYSWGVSYDVRTVKLDNFSAQTRGWHVNLAVLF